METNPSNIHTRNVTDARKRFVETFGIGNSFVADDVVAAGFRGNRRNATDFLERTKVAWRVNDNHLRLYRNGIIWRIVEAS